MEKKIISVVKYFSFFAYQPTLKEIHTFLQAKISKNKLKMKLELLVKQKRIVKSSKYTLGEYSISSLSSRAKSRDLAKRNIISKRKLQNWRYRSYIKLLSLFPQIKLVGLSGSISMMNAGEEDDIDLFIITAKNRLFTGRFIALMLAQVMGLRRNRKAGVSQVAKNLYPSLLQSSHKDKVCLNLFFDESNLKVPKFKQTEFVGHEVLQMKPIIVKGNVYERFLEANKWVFRLFPNAVTVFSMKYKVSGIKILNTKYFILNTISNWLENLLKNLQLKLINYHKTTEIITSTQLWFHPDDFEEKIKKLRG